MFDPGLVGTIYIWIGCLILAPVLAAEKGQGGGLWLVAALFFGPLALIAAAGLPDKRARLQQDPTD